MFFKSGALKNLIEEINKYKLDILSVEEMRWLEQRKIDLRSYSLYFSCQDKQHPFGTGFVASNRIKVIHFKPIKERICKVRLNAKSQNMSINCLQCTY